VRKLGRSAFLLENEGVFYILKKQPDAPPSAWRRVLRRVTNGSLPFQNEIKTTAHIGGMDLGALSVPQLVRLDADGSMILSRLAGIDSRSMSAAQRGTLLDGLFKINTCAAPPMFPWWKEGLFRLLDSPFPLSVRRLWRSGLGLRDRLKAIRLLSRFVLTTRFSRSVLLHNDLVIGNVMIDGEASVGLIDFEDAIYDRHFLLADAIDVSFDSQTFHLDMRSIDYFSHRMIDAGFSELSSRSALTACIRCCLLRHCAHRMVSVKTSGTQRMAVESFVTGTLMNPRNFSIWLEQQNV